MTRAAAQPLTLGRYEIVKHLADGGMADVLLARTTGIEGFERHVVIKRIRADQAQDARFVAMFLDEARLAASLHHHNIVTVHDIGEEDGHYFFAMEYVHGEDANRLLQQVSARGELVPLEHAITIVMAAAAGLHHAHEQRGPDRAPLGIVHRDVSPANILIGFDGGVKLVDFGIAKAAHRREQTQSGTLKGKVSYMSPEQCLGEPVDRRSDVFSLGIVLYELVTAMPLFHAESEFLTMRAIVNRDIPPASRFRADVPPQLETILDKALASAADDRYATADEMRRALEDLAVSAGLRTSTTALADYMKERFGTRLEPWLEAEVQDAEDDEPEIEMSPASAVLVLDVERAASTAATAEGDRAPTELPAGGDGDRVPTVHATPGATDDDDRAPTEQFDRAAIEAAERDESEAALVVPEEERPGRTTVPLGRPAVRVADAHPRDRDRRETVPLGRPGSDPAARMLVRAREALAASDAPAPAEAPQPAAVADPPARRRRRLPLALAAAAAMGVALLLVARPGAERATPSPSAAAGEPPASAPTEVGTAPAKERVTEAPTAPTVDEADRPGEVVPATPPAEVAAPAAPATGPASAEARGPGGAAVRSAAPPAARAVAREAAGPVPASHAGAVHKQAGRAPEAERRPAVPGHEAEQESEKPVGHWDPNALFPK